MLGAVKDEHLARYGLGRDQVRVLRHVSRAVDLARVVDPLHDVDPRLARGERVPAELAPLVVVRAAVEHVRAWPAARGDLHGRDLQVVRCLAGRVRAEQQAVNRVGFVGGPGSVKCGVRTHVYEYICVLLVETWIGWTTIHARRDARFFVREPLAS